MNTPLPLDAAALDRWSALLARIIDHSDGTRPFAEVYDDELEPFIAQARAALALRARVAELEQRERAFEEREAKCCPEDVGFDEYIASLTKRVAELEAELAEARSGALAQRAVVVCNDLARIDKERIEWQATANALRDALEEISALNECEVADCSTPACLPGKIARAALAAHPAASLAAYRKSVLEEAQERVVAALREYHEALTRNESFLCAVAVAESKDRAIRALAAQEVKR